VISVVDADLYLRFLVGAPGRPPAPPTEQAAKEVVQVDVTVAEALGEKVVVHRGRRPSAPTTGALAPAPGALALAARRPGPGIHALGSLAKGRSVAIVPGPSVGIGKDVVGLGKLFEALLGSRVLVDIGMVAPRQLAISTLNLVGGGRAGHAQDIVEVLGSHP